MPRASARVRVELEVEPGDVWGVDCTIGQAVSQARVAAEQKIRRLFTDAVTPDAELACKRTTLHGIRIASIGPVEVVLKSD